MVCFLLLQKSFLQINVDPGFSFLSFGVYVCFRECIIDTRLLVSLILRYEYWYLGIIDTRVGYLRLCMQYVKITLG